MVTWRHQMETFSALLTLCAGNSPVPGEFPSKASVAELWRFLWSAPEQTVEQTNKTPVIWDAIALIMMSLQWHLQYTPNNSLYIFVGSHEIYPGLIFYMHAWWPHQMEIFAALLALCAGNSSVPVNSLHKGQWRRTSVFSFICVWISDCANNREAGDLRCHRGHYDVNVMGFHDYECSHNAPQIIPISATNVCLHSGTIKDQGSMRFPPLVFLRIRGNQKPYERYDNYFHDIYVICWIL